MCKILEVINARYVSLEATILDTSAESPLIGASPQESKAGGTGAGVAKLSAPPVCMCYEVSSNDKATLERIDNLATGQQQTILVRNLRLSSALRSLR